MESYTCFRTYLSMQLVAHFALSAFSILHADNDGSRGRQQAPSVTGPWVLP